MKFTCAHCGKPADKPASAVNRARREYRNLYCNRVCSGLGRRKWNSAEQRKAEKAAYDAKYRASNKRTLKAKKRAYFKRTYDPIKAAEQRKERMPYHVEYCRRPQYREKKKAYDRRHRAVKNYGPLADCFLLTLEIRDTCLALQSDYEIRMSKGTFGKSQQRKRDYERLERKKPEIGPLGNLELRS